MLRLDVHMHVCLQVMIGMLHYNICFVDILELVLCLIKHITGALLTTMHYRPVCYTTLSCLAVLVWRFHIVTTEVS